MPTGPLPSGRPLGFASGLLSETPPCSLGPRTALQPLSSGSRRKLVSPEVSLLHQEGPRGNWGQETGRRGGGTSWEGALGGRQGRSSIRFLPPLCSQGKGARPGSRRRHGGGGGRSEGPAWGHRTQGGCLTLSLVTLIARPGVTRQSPSPGTEPADLVAPVPWKREMGRQCPRLGSHLLPVPSEPGLWAQQISTFCKPHTEQTEPGQAVSGTPLEGRPARPRCQPGARPSSPVTLPAMMSPSFLGSLVSPHLSWPPRDPPQCPRGSKVARAPSSLPPPAPQRAVLPFPAAEKNGRGPGGGHPRPA